MNSVDNNTQEETTTLEESSVANTEQGRPEDQTVPEYSDRHEIKNPDNAYTEFDLKNKSKHGILFPTTLYEKLVEFIKTIEPIPAEEFELLYNDSQRFSTGMAIESERFNVIDDVYAKKLNKTLDRFINIPNYSDSSLEMRAITPKTKEGNLSGQVAINVFTSLLGVGEVTQIPLWHSGFWITIKPPVIADLINLEQAIANNQILLGRETNTLVYSNYSVVFNRIVVDFILSHMISCSLKLPVGDDIRDYISTQDLYPLILGMLNSMYPNGIDVTRGCINTTRVEDDKTPKCTFIGSGNLDTKKLIWINRKSLNSYMLDIMSKRRPDSVSVDEVKEYQRTIKEMHPRTINIDTENGNTVSFTFKIPTLREYIDNGEAWVNNVIKKSEELFTEQDSAEIKNMKVNDILLSIVLGIYNIFVSEIKSNQYDINDIETITSVLEILSADNKLFETFNKEVSKYISDAVIAVVATPNFECPVCKQESQTDSTVVNKAFKELIPLNVLETFFALSVLRINQTRLRPIS